MKQRRTRCRPRRALLQLEALEARCAPAAGALDPTFDGDGKATTDFPQAGFPVARDRGQAVAVQADGKIVVVGRTDRGSSESEDFALARYNQDGSLDTTFGVSGKVITHLGVVEEATSVAIQADGKIVVAGGTDFDYGSAVLRYNPDGTLDRSFDSDGVRTGDLQSRAFDLAIQADGKIVIVGGNAGDFEVVRYNPDGSRDTSFGGTGTVKTDFGDEDVALAVAVQTDGRIIAAGNRGRLAGNVDFALARYNRDGSLDSTFGVGGKVTTDFAGRFDEAHDMAVQADGKIVVGGADRPATGPDRFALVRYHSNGSLDTSFGAGGKVSTSFPAFGGGTGLTGLAIQTNGKIVAAGLAASPTSSDGGDFALARYNVNGSLDTAFGINGLVTTAFSTALDLASGIALQIDGKIVVAGTTRSDLGDASKVPDFAVARYEGDPTGQEPPRPAFSFAISAVDRQVYRHRLDLPSRTSSSWMPTAPGQFRDIAVTEHGAGHAPVVFGLGIDQQIYVARFSVSGDLLSGWSRFAPGFFDSLDAGTYGSGKPFVVGVGTLPAANNEGFVATFDAQANLVSGWTRVAPGQFSSAVVGHFGNGNALIFGVGRDDPEAYAARFDSSGSMMDGWVHFAPGKFSTLSVGNRTNGTLELFGLGLDHRLYAANFGSSGLLRNGFFPAPSLDPTGPNLFDLLSVAPLSNNHLKAFALARDPADHRIFTAQFDTSGALSSGWTALSGQNFTFLDAGSQSGVVKVYGVDETDSRVYLALFNSLGALTDPFGLTAPGGFVDVRPAP